MKMLVRILLCLATVAICNARADDVVLSVQRKLKQLGFYNGVVDGQMGSQTAAAIRRYQIAERLRVTGMMNSQTLRRLGISAPRTRAPVRAARRRRNTLLSRIFSKAGPFISVGPEVQIAVIRQAKRNLRLLGYLQRPDRRIGRLPPSYPLSEHGRRAPGFAKRGVSMKTRSRASP